MGTQLWPRFIFQLLSGIVFLNKSLCWFYNEVHHGKVPMDDVGGIITNIIFWKVNSGQIVAHTPKEFSDAAMKLVLSIIIVYLPKSDEIFEPESIHQAPSIPETLSIHKFVWQINDRGVCSIKFFKTVVDQEAFTLNGTKKLEMLFVVRRSKIKVIASVQHAGNGTQKMRVNGCNLWTVVSRNMFLHLNLIFNLVSDGNNLFFTLLI